MKTTVIRVLLAAVVSLLFFAAPASAATKYVNCDAGQSIGKAIDTAKGSAGLLEIYVSGECDEVITIRRSDVRIYGDPSAQINGTVRVFSSSNVRLFDITISAPGPGLWVSAGEVVTNRVNLIGNDESGLISARSSNVWFRNGMIIGNCESIEDEDCADGASVVTASLQLRNVTVSQNRRGVEADVGSRIFLDTAGPGVTEIVGNSVVGIQVSLHSVVDLRGKTYIYDNRYHAIFATHDSGIRILARDVEVYGNIGCLGEESSFDNWGGGVITGTDCSGF